MTNNKILGIIIALLMMLPASLSAAVGDTFYYNGLNYRVSGQTTVAVSDKNNGSSQKPAEGEIVIPEKVIYNDVEFIVTAIEQQAFYQCSRLTSITIPNSVTTIGGHAFMFCDRLTSISIPNSVTTIGGYTFMGCNSLTSISIPNSVTTIGEWAFEGCDRLTSITIPNSVTTIGEWAFEGCERLTSISIPNSVTTIGQEAFSSCKSLHSINVDADNQVYSSKDDVLYNKEQTSLIQFPIGKLRKPGKVIIPNSVTIIGAGAFSSCDILTSITIPNSVTTIGERAFFDCTGLTSISIPNSVTTIGGYTFMGCNSLTSISIPNSVTTIGNRTFYGCDRLTSITIPNSVTTIGYGAFYGCAWLTSITIPNSVTTIGQEAFSQCTGLTSVTSFAVTPPECGEDAFKNVHTDNCPLYVPAKSIQAYKLAPEWRKFAIIEAEFGTGIETIEVGAEGAAEVYNLMGVKVADSLDNLPAGIYIVNGRKVVVK